MNNRTAHIQFKVILDKNAQGVAFGGAPAFLPQEIDLFLNQGQDEIISNKISGNNVLKVGFEGSQQRISELDALVRTDIDAAHDRLVGKTVAGAHTLAQTGGNGVFIKRAAAPVGNQQPAGVGAEVNGCQSRLFHFFQSSCFCRGGKNAGGAFCGCASDQAICLRGFRGRPP